MNSSFCTNNPLQNLPCAPTTSATDNINLMAARSRHPGGVNVVLCDGSVHFVRDGISILTWRALSTIAGGEVAAIE
jgi:prepilin-type processing-associated H-X9-DG protein